MQMINLANAVEHEIKTTVIQTKEVRPGVHRNKMDLMIFEKNVFLSFQILYFFFSEARILPETVKFDSMPYNEELVGLHTGDNTRKSKCCKEPEKK